MKKKFLALFGLFTLSITLTNLGKIPFYLYAHGLADTAAQAFNYDDVLFNGPFGSFNFNDATRNFWRLNFTQTAFGQLNEIECLAKDIQARITR